MCECCASTAPVTACRMRALAEAVDASVTPVAECGASAAPVTATAACMACDRCARHCRSSISSALRAGDAGGDTAEVSAVVPGARLPDELSRGAPLPPPGKRAGAALAGG